MSRALLRRLARMQPGELHFRVLCELRKAASRVRSATSTPRWDRRRLARVIKKNASGSIPWQAAMAALDRADHADAHAALGEHLAQRTTAFPINARGVRAVAEKIRRDFPSASSDAVQRADALLQGRYELLGYRDLLLGTTPDWHTDPVNRRHSPRVFWSTVPYLNPTSGDHKVIWELNRHQHWLTLGRAYALSGDRRYYTEFTLQLASWLVGNPPLIGINWASMLELALRSLSWLWALEIFAPAATKTDSEPWLVDFLLALDRQLTHVEHNLSHYFSPNTHLSGEALALYVSGLALPELQASVRRAALGRNVLLREASRQVRSDGGHAELSPHYHRYSTDFYLLATCVARLAGDSCAAVFEEAARKQARYLRTITDDSGMRPSIGDDDGGQLFPICGRSSADCRDSLATASVLLSEPALAIGPPPEETYWMCGGRLETDVAETATTWTSTALTASGYFVSRTARGDHLVFDAGPHGYLNGGHAHADALSCTLTVGGLPLLIDPGTATYTMDRQLRDRFRSSMMHNTVALEGRSQSEPRGAFHWKSIANAHAPIWRSSNDSDYIEGTHDGYAPRRHTRAVLAIHGLGWWIMDHVLGPGATLIEHYWHIHPSWTCSLDRTRQVCRMENSGRTLALATSAPLSLLEPGQAPFAMWSPVYGIVEPAPVCRSASAAPLPVTIATFIPATAEAAGNLTIEPLKVERLPGAEWHASAFRVRWHRGAMAILSCVERTGLADRDTAAPADRWGTAELQTDARVAVLVDHAAGPSEVILVNGAFVTAHPAHQLVSLSRRVPLLRLPASRLAPSVHEVGTGEF